MECLSRNSIKVQLVPGNQYCRAHWVVTFVQDGRSLTASLMQNNLTWLKEHPKEVLRTIEFHANCHQIGELKGLSGYQRAL